MSWPVGHGLDSSRMRNWNQVSQLELFDSCHGILADDERGRITYIPGFVDAETAQAWFTELHRGVRWRSERRDMYDREVDVPRLLGSFRLDAARAGTPTAILDAAKRVVAHLGVPFNSVGLNLYRDGRDSVAPHNDHLYDIREGFRDRSSFTGRDTADDDPGQGGATPFRERGFGDGKPSGHGLRDGDPLYPRRTQDERGHCRTHQSGVSR